MTKATSEPLERCWEGSDGISYNATYVKAETHDWGHVNSKWVVKVYKNKKNHGWINIYGPKGMSERKLIESVKEKFEITQKST